MACRSGNKDRLYKKIYSPEYEDIVKLLLDKGVNPHLQLDVKISDKSEKLTAMDIAVKNGNYEIAKLLLHYCYNDHKKALELSVKDKKRNITKLFDEIYRRKCVACLENQVSFLFEPCKHAVICKECYNSLPSPKECPICRTNITRISNSVDAREYN